MENKSDPAQKAEELTPQSNKRYKQSVELLSESLAQGDLGMLTGFSPMKRIEVKWVLEQPGEENEQEVNENEVWWPATVVGRTNELFDLPENEDEEDEPGALQKLPVYSIRYDAMPPDFPNPEMSKVCILEDHLILDTKSGESLAWRHEGTDWEPKEEDDEDGEEEEVDIKPLPEALKDALERLRAEATATSSEPVPSAVRPSEDAAKAEAANFVDELIRSLTERHQSQFMRLSRANQNAIVERVAKVKKMLVNRIACRLMENGCLSAEDAQSIVEELRGV